MTRRVLAERVVRYELRAGTELPVLDRLERDQRPGRRPTWIVTRGLCNGTPARADEYRTLTEARAAFDALAGRS